MERKRNLWFQIKIHTKTTKRTQACWKLNVLPEQSRLFRKPKENFQHELKKDLRKIGKIKSRSTNYYKVPELEYDSLLLKSIRKSYKNVTKQ